ncbi:MAG: type II toxin-antitoxin system prevent-host-death family antitoxin [Acidobacteria bacterium]|nr:type II toxin-antitoxin system prevent-host-death family antitoxin [Acidobacteriota bacterium]
MRSAAVAELKASLSHYLAKVRAGEEVLVTDRGTPIARIVPVPRSGKVAEHLRKMEKEGLIVIGRGGLPKGFWSHRRPSDAKGSVLAALIQERREGR